MVKRPSTITVAIVDINSDWKFVEDVGVDVGVRQRIARKGPSKGKVVRLTSQVIKHYLILGTHHQPIRQLGLCEKGKNASKCKLEKIKSENKMKNQMRCGKDQKASFDTAKDKSKTNFQIGQPQQDDPRVPLRPIDRPLFEIKVKGQQSEDTNPDEGQAHPDRSRSSSRWLSDSSSFSIRSRCFIKFKWLEAEVKVKDCVTMPIAQLSFISFLMRQCHLPDDIGEDRAYYDIVTSVLETAFQATNPNTV
ncbi:hypothetical protein RUM44_009153 [Polyplax serrata]|uniref:Uncharacterized protein n=1 Tax=Polyplax serrata TaxID=468196 RepID=A0ABR1ARV5_POLSC